MTNGFAGWDPQRLHELKAATDAAIWHLAATRFDHVLCEEFRGPVSSIRCRLEELRDGVIMPVLNSDSMSSFEATSPGSVVLSSGFAAGHAPGAIQTETSQDGAEVDPVVAELLVLTERATNGDDDALEELISLLADTDDSAVLEAYLRTLGAEGFAALLETLDATDRDIDDIDPSGRLTAASVVVNREFVERTPLGFIALMAIETANEDSVSDADGNVSGSDLDDSDEQTIEARIREANDRYALGMSEAEVADTTRQAVALAAIADRTDERDQFDGDGTLVAVEDPSHSGSLLLARHVGGEDGGLIAVSGVSAPGQWTASSDWTLGLPAFTGAGEPVISPLGDNATTVPLRVDATEVEGSRVMTDDLLTDVEACAYLVGWQHVGTEYRTMVETVGLGDGVTATITYSEGRSAYYVGDCIGVGPFSIFRPSDDELRHDSWYFSDVEAVEFFVDGQSVSGMTIAQLYEGDPLAVQAVGTPVIEIAPGTVEVLGYGTYSSPVEAG